jgi:hypothetical protein
MVKNFDAGYLYGMDGKKYDISVVFNFPTNDDWESTDELLCPNLIDFYYGEPNERDSEYYFNKFVEKQNRFQSLLNKLYSLKSICPDDTEIDEQINFVKSLIVKIY